MLIEETYASRLKNTKGGRDGLSWSGAKSEFVDSSGGGFTLPWFNRVLRGKRVKRDMLQRVAQLLYVHLDEICLAPGESSPRNLHGREGQALRSLYVDDRRACAELRSPPGYGRLQFLEEVFESQAKLSVLRLSVVDTGGGGLEVLGEEGGSIADLGKVVGAFCASPQTLVVLEVGECACKRLGQAGPSGAAARGQLRGLRAACMAAAAQLPITLGGLDHLSAYGLFFSNVGGEAPEKSATIQRHFDAVGTCPVLIKAISKTEVWRNRHFSMRQFSDAEFREHFEAEARAFALFWFCLPISCRAILAVSCFVEVRLTPRLLSSLAKALLLDKSVRECLLDSGQEDALVGGEAAGLIEYIRLLQRRGLLLEDEFGLSPAPWLRFFFRFSSMVESGFPERVAACLLREAANELSAKPELRARCLAGLGRWEEAATSFLQYLKAPRQSESPHDDLLELFGLFLDPRQHYQVFSEACAEHLPDPLQAEIIESLHRLLLAGSGHGDPMLVESNVVLSGNWRRLKEALAFDVAVTFLNKVWGWRIYTAANEEALNWPFAVLDGQAARLVQHAERVLPVQRRRDSGDPRPPAGHLRWSVHAGDLPGADLVAIRPARTGSSAGTGRLRNSSS